MKVGVVGSRSFRDYRRMVEELDALDLSVADEIVSGGCGTGADYLAEQYSRYRKHPLKVFKAEWNKYGKAAGPIRNLELIKYCDRVVVFWDGSSRGSADVIARCLELKKEFSIVFFRQFKLKEAKPWKNRTRV